MATGQIEIERRDRVTHGEYFAKIAGESATGKLTWTLRDGARHAEHTFVPEDLRGRGIAAQLVDALIGDARREGFKIVPACSYVEAAFRRHPEWSDLRA